MLNTALEICKECCKKLNIYNNINEVINYKYSDHINLNDCCCEQFYKFTNLNISVQVIIAYIQIYLEIYEDRIINGQQKYSIGGHKNISLNKAEQIKNKVKKELNKAIDIFKVANEIYQKTRLNFHKKINEKKELLQKIKMNEQLINKLRTKINQLDNFKTARQNEFNELRNEYNSLSCAIDQKKSNQNKINALNSEITQKRNQINSLNDELNDVKRKISNKTSGMVATGVATVFGAFFSLGISLAVGGSAMAAQGYQKSKLNDKKNNIEEKISELKNEIYYLEQRFPNRSNEKDTIEMNKNFQRKLTSFEYQIKNCYY